MVETLSVRLVIYQYHKYLFEQRIVVSRQNIVVMNMNEYKRRTCTESYRMMNLLVEDTFGIFRRILYVSLYTFDSAEFDFYMFYS